MPSHTYQLGAVITGILFFIGSWIYCIAHYGFLFGVGLGWLPSIIVAFAAGLLWPALAFVAVGSVALIVFFNVVASR